MLDEYVQQWSAIQTVRAANLLLDEVVGAYFGLAGEAGALAVEGYLAGLVMLPASERNLLAQAINELLDSTGSLADGAHYTDPDAASSSGYGDYLRALDLSPDDYDFTAPPAGDNSTSVVGTITTPAAGVEASPPDAGSPAVPGSDGKGPEADEIEFRRLDALHESGLLDTGAEDRFDRITRQARDHFGVSSASIALITKDSQVIKSVVGPLGQDLPRDLSLCATTIEQDRTLVIPDAGSHPDWRDHPLVAGGPAVRFYAGHPISTAGGWRIGTLCLMDHRPRVFTEDDAQILRRLAAQVQIELWV